MIAALVTKDVKLFFRNQFFALVSGLGLVAFIVIYFLLPSSVDNSLGIGLYTETPAETTLDERLGELLDVQPYDSEAALTAAVEGGEHAAGLVLPADEAAAIARGEPSRLRVLYAPGTPDDVRESFNAVLTMGINGVVQASDSQLADVGGETEVLGPDLLGEPLSLRDRLLPALLLTILSVETMGLATLLAEERERGTARAVLTTPLSLGGFFTSKAVMGVGLAFVQVLILVVVTGKILAAPGIIMVTLLTGSLLVTGLAFLIASVATDMMSVLAWSMLMLVVLAVPAFTILFPATATGWVDAIPSFYLVDTLHRAINFGASWADVSYNLLILFVTGVISLALGSVALRRQFQ